MRQSLKACAIRSVFLYWRDTVFDVNARPHFLLKKERCFQKSEVSVSVQTTDAEKSVKLRLLYSSS